MEKDISLLAEQIKQQIIDKLNNSGKVLPPILIYYIIKDVYQSVERSYKKYLLDVQKEQSREEDKNK